MKTIFLFIPHYVFSSDLLHTEYIKGLSKKYRVIVFSPIFSQTPAENYFRSDNIKYLPWQEENPRFWLLFTKTLRISLIREFDNLEYFKLRQLMKINLNWQRKFLRAVGKIIPKNLATADTFTKLEKLLLPGSTRFKKMLDEYQPDIVLTCTPGFSSIEAEIIILCKRHKIKTMAINSSWDNFTSNATQFRKTDYLVCWNKVMKDEAMRIHNYEESHVFVSGVYRFDHHFQNHPNEISKEKFLEDKGLDKNLKTLLLGTVPPNTYPPQYEVWRELIKMRERGELAEKVNIFIRLHPNDSLEKYDEFKNIKNLHIELAGTKMKPTGSTSHKIELSEGDLDNLRYSLKYTDININFRSSLSLEATIYDQPVINIGLHDYANRYHVDWYIPIINSGGVRLVKTADELKDAINQYLKDPTLDNQGREKIFRDYIGFRDGLSYKRSLEALENVI